MSANEMAMALDVRGRLHADALLRLTWLVLFGLLPTVLMIAALRERGLGWDFRAFYVGARAYLSGASPYPAHSLAALADKQGFVYPAPMAALFAPLTLLPYTASLALWLIGSVAAIAVALRILGVRDWRCLGALFLTHPVEESVRLGTLMPLLTLLLALLWKYRERVVVAGGLAAVLALSKIFLFPLLLWLAATRRLGTAALGALVAAALCILGWIPLHLTTLATYPALLHALARYEETFSYSLTSLGIGAGLSAATATTLAWSAGAAIGASVVMVGRRADFLAFRLALAASFLFSPIVWGHYYLLLAVPLALLRPRLSPIWLAAIWIRADTLALRNASVWIALALLVLFLQLDLAQPLTRRAFAWPTPHARIALGVSLALGLLIASGATAQAGYTRTATLRPEARRDAASGAASIRVEPRHRQICWRIWTQFLPPRRATILIESTVRLEPPLVLHARIQRDGQTQGCARVARNAPALARGLVDRPGRYRIVVAVPRTAPISGSLRRQ
jgi:glycosyl transferase family 87